MSNLYDLLMGDARFADALKACMNCGICTAICPAAEFYNYDPRRICDIVQRRNEEEIENLLRSEAIWFCGQCLACKTRCPRQNVPAEVILVLRKIAIRLGYMNEKVAEQQKRLAETTGRNILEIGYCVHPDRVNPDLHPEQGPIWEWYVNNIEAVAPKLGANYHGDGPGALRKIREENLQEVRKIFERTGGDALNRILTEEK